MVTNTKKKYTSSVPLATYRVVFGAMMLISIIRFFYFGWIDSLYIDPQYFFSYYNFEWIKPLGSSTYIVFFIAGISALGVMFGKYYRLSIVLFFLSFTYIQLMDKTNYLNHYYFISLVSFIMIFLAMNASYSLDANNPKIRKRLVHKWTITTLKLFVGIVYFYAGLCKLNSDWLVHAMPLKIWLPSKHYIPIVGAYMDNANLPYIFSWMGALFDLSIPFLLIWKRTRGMAFLALFVFHLLTWILFPIGMFPFIMIGGALIYFSAEWHENLWKYLSKMFGFKELRPYDYSICHYPFINKIIIGIVLLFHVLFPWRYLLYPGELFWTEEGYRFSWRVMLIEKSGYAQFVVVDGITKEKYSVENSDFLTPTQEKQMSFQPDFIVEYAHHLKDFYHKNKNVQEPEVYADVYVSLNGRKPQRLIDNKINLINEKDSFKPKTWITTFKGTIKGL